MLEKRFLTIMLLGILLAGCGPIDTATQPPGEIQTTGQTPEVVPTEPPEAELTPLEWLVQSAFAVSAQEPPIIIPTELPEDFTASDQRRILAETPSGFVVQKTEVTFERSVGGQVSTEDHIIADVYAYGAPEGRAEHLDLIAAQEYKWDFWDLDGQRMARYYSSSVDGRVWISGPYLIVIYSGLDTSEVGPWVDTFASLFLVMFPPQ